jgi:hypothetical protein
VDPLLLVLCDQKAQTSDEQAIQQCLGPCSFGLADLPGPRFDPHMQAAPGCIEEPVSGPAANRSSQSSPHGQPQLLGRCVHPRQGKDDIGRNRLGLGDPKQSNGEHETRGRANEGTAGVGGEVDFHHWGIGVSKNTQSARKNIEFVFWMERGRIGGKCIENTGAARESALRSQVVRKCTWVAKQRPISGRWRSAGGVVSVIGELGRLAIGTRSRADSPGAW